MLRHCKTFLATTSIADGPIRVVIVRFENGETAAYFRTDLNMSVEMILEAVAGRWAIEEFFHDSKSEVDPIIRTTSARPLDSARESLLALGAIDFPRRLIV